MTSLADKVARVKELHDAVGYNSKDFSPCAEIRFFQHGEQMAALITQLWEENQKQREANKTRYDEGYNDGGNSRNHDFMDALSENTNFDADGDVGIDDICSYVKNLEQTIEQQREVLGVARNALSGILPQGGLHYGHVREALTAIDNVMKGEGV